MLPAQPVLLHLTVHEWCTQKLTPRRFYQVGDELKGATVSGYVYPDTPWERVDLESTRVCHHYSQPCLSPKHALEPHVLNGEPGFGLLDLTGEDCLHPANGRHGVAYLSAMLAHWFDRAHAMWRVTRHVNPRLNRRTVLPAPLHVQNQAQAPVARCYAFQKLTGKVESQSQRGLPWCSPQQTVSNDGAAALSCTPLLDDSHATCDIGGNRASSPHLGVRSADVPANSRYRALMATPQIGWFWCPVSLGGRNKPSAGVVALTPGSVLVASVDAYLPQAAPQRPGMDDGALAPADATLFLEHLVSYEGMGRVRVRCGKGCTCTSTVIDAHRIDSLRNSSVFVTTPVRVSALPSPRCELRLVLLSESSGGGHKFKLRGITVVAAAPESARADQRSEPQPAAQARLPYRRDRRGT